jgi:NAD(P)-dependent dehydrogenase (short-subunit alcohol dehydrogenase family)
VPSDPHSLKRKKLGMSHPLTGRSTVGMWLDDPAAAHLLTEALTGVSPATLSMARTLPLSMLSSITGGQLSQDAVDDVILRANGGALPLDDEPVPAFIEKITPGRFARKTIIVTGAGNGIGRATASRIAREGGRIVAVDIAPRGLDDLKAGLPDADVVNVVADISREEDIEKIVAACDGRIDGLANVAGVADDMLPLHETTDDVWERVMRINVEGMFRLMRAVLPGMIDAGSGSIVNITSEAGLRGSCSGLAYTTSKHAVIGIVRSAAFMYGPNGIRINGVAPGGVATGMPVTFASDFAMERLKAAGSAALPALASSEQLASSITYLLSDDATNLNGVILPSDGGWSVL